MRFLHFTFWFGTDSLAPTNREFIMLTLIHDTLMPIIGLDKEKTFRTPVTSIFDSVDPLNLGRSPSQLLDLIIAKVICSEANYETFSAPGASPQCLD